MIALALVYVGLATIVGATLAVNRAPLAAKAVVIPVSLALGFAVWQAAQPPTGWPATATPAKNGQLVGGFVREPDRLSHDRGEIDLLAVPPGFDHPRLYRVPYTRQTHEQLQMALAAAKRGVRVGVKMVKRPKGERGPKVRPQFYLLPPPKLPTKN